MTPLFKSGTRYARVESSLRSGKAVGACMGKRFDLSKNGMYDCLVKLQEYYPVERRGTFIQLRSAVTAPSKPLSTASVLPSLLRGKPVTIDPRRADGWVQFLSTFVETGSHIDLRHDGRLRITAQSQPICRL